MMERSIELERSDPFSVLRLVEGPAALRTLAQLLSGLVVAVVFCLIFVPWQQNVPGSGKVAALAPFDRIQVIQAPVGGRVRNAWVVEGSRVEAGDRLLEIVDNDPSILDRLEAQRVALESQLTSAEDRVSAFEKQIATLESSRELAMDAARSLIEVAQAKARSAQHGLEGARSAAQQAKLNFERQRDLVRDGLVSELEFEIAQRESEQANAQVSQARQTLEAARGDVSARRSDLGRIDTRAQAGVESARAVAEEAEVEAAALQERIASLGTRIARQSTQLITAPRAGTVFRLFASPGAELVTAGAPLVSLIPDTNSRAVELWVDGNHIPLIEEGRPVRLQFEGWPAVQFAGWPAVAVGTFGGRVALVDPSDDGQGRFRLLIVPDPADAPWPEPRFLRQGVRAKGFVLLDQVSLGYELWRQSNGFPPTVTPDPGSDGSVASKEIM